MVEFWFGGVLVVVFRCGGVLVWLCFADDISLPAADEVYPALTISAPAADEV